MDEKVSVISRATWAVKVSLPLANVSVYETEKL